MDHFQSLNVDDICNQISNDTYYNSDSVITTENVKKIKNELSLWNFKINKNDILPTKTFNGWFHSMAIAKSKTVCDIVTSKTLLDICSKYIGPEFRLKAHRVYSELIDPFFPFRKLLPLKMMKHFLELDRSSTSISEKLALLVKLQYQSLKNCIWCSIKWRDRLFRFRYTLTCIPCTKRDLVPKVIVNLRSTYKVIFR